MFRFLAGILVAIVGLNFLKKGKQVVTTKARQTQNEWDDFWR